MRCKKMEKICNECGHRWDGDEDDKVCPSCHDEEGAYNIYYKTIDWNTEYDGYHDNYEDAMKEAREIPRCYDDYSVGDWSIGDFKLTGTIEFMTGDGKNYPTEFIYASEKLELTKPKEFPEEEWGHARDYLEEEVRDFLEEQLLDMRD